MTASAQRIPRRPPRHLHPNLLHQRRKKKETAPAPAPAPVQNTVQEPQMTIEHSMTSVLSSFSESIQALTMSLNKLKADFKTLEKQVIREAKSMDKVNAKRNKNKGPVHQVDL